MKKYIKMYFCVAASFVLSINTMLIATQAETISHTPYVVLDTYSNLSNEKYIIKDPYNVMTQEQRDFVGQVFNKFWTQIWNKYGNTSEIPIVTFSLDDRIMSVGAGGNAFPEQYLIVFKQDFFDSMKKYYAPYSVEHAEASILHELAHITQCYQNTKTFSWLTEGMADYIISEYSQYQRKNIPEQYTEGELYDGYQVTAGFLNWLEKKYPNTVMKLHRIMQQGNIEYETFQTLTGKTLADLWKEYSGKTLPSMEQYLLSQSNASDMTELATYYYYGYDKEPNYQKAFQYYQKAAEGGDSYAMVMIAEIYKNGDLGEKDYQKALEYYQKVVNLQTYNSGYACNEIAGMIQEGHITSMNIQQAIAYYKQTIALNERTGTVSFESVVAMSSLGDIYLDMGSAEAISWYEKMAQHNIGHGQNMLGDIYKEGKLIAKDIQKAKEYYMVVVESPDAPKDNKRYAMDCIGDLYREAEDIQAISWYEKAAEYSSFYAQNWLGYLYLHGVIVEKDVNKAKQYFTNVIQSVDSSDSDKEYANDMLKSIE